ncbi:MAG: UbiA family prenyltransferase [Caldilineaceae bacterium]
MYGEPAAAMWFVTAFGYVSNDYVDVVEDAVNKPDRPLPRGTVSSAAARGLIFGLAVGVIAQRGHRLAALGSGWRRHWVAHLIQPTA